MQHVEVEPLPLERLGRLLAPERARRLMETGERARELLAGRTVWNVNATAQGGGVAEMLQTLVAYGRGAGVDTRWSVLRGDATFFAITKRLHNVLHGSPGDGGPLGAAEREHYDRVLAGNLAAVRAEVRAGDVVLLHDPQTAGLAAGLRAAGAHVVWRCHIGSDAREEVADQGWDFLRADVVQADATVWSRRQYAPDWVDGETLHVIPPSIDPFTAKNLELDPAEIPGILLATGLVTGEGPRPRVAFSRRDGSPDHLRHHEDLVRDGRPPPLGSRLVVQVSRWDRLKDMAGVLKGFAEHIGRFGDDVHLMLVGPDVSGVSDDPEGAEVLAECTALWGHLPEAARRRSHIVTLPMDDIDENAIIVNALQRHATVVVQKSLVEGFGLTVTEAMWKGTPVVASAVGGINDQIEDGVDGLLLADPLDLDSFATALAALLDDATFAARLGTAGRERVRRQFLGDRHLGQYADLFEALVAAPVR